jgi:hypothetical protein
MIKRATVTLSDDVGRDLEEYLARTTPTPSFTAVVQTALRQFLAQQKLESLGFRPAAGPLRITPAEPTRVLRHVAEQHDQFLADHE